MPNTGVGTSGSSATGATCAAGWVAGAVVGAERAHDAATAAHAATAIAGTSSLPGLLDLREDEYDTGDVRRSMSGKTVKDRKLRKSLEKKPYLCIGPRRHQPQTADRGASDSLTSGRDIRRH
jgi:hypothetical protein